MRTLTAIGLLVGGAALASCSVYGEDLLEPGSGGSSSGKTTSAGPSGGGGAGGDATTSTTTTSSEASTTQTATTSTTTTTSTGMGGDPTGGGGSGGGVVGTEAWVNEIHYDNASGDLGEGVEIAGSAGLDLTGWSIVTYNGSNGMISASGGTVSLSGTIPNQMNGLGTKWFSVPGLENGAPDGVALVDDNNTVIQFLSYEGAFSATGGPATGLMSQALPVDEEPAPAAGTSLQLTGSGSSYASFTWSENVAASPDQINPGQTFQ